METMREIVLQEMNEMRFNRMHVDAKIREEIKANPDMCDKMAQGVVLLQQYMAGSYYESKMKRIAQLVNLDLEAMVLDLFTGIAYCLRPELFTSVTAQLASRLKFSDKTEAITTVAEITAVLCATDAFDIEKANKMASLMVVSNIPLSEKLVTFIEESQFLPPMVCEPLELTHNYSSGYLTHNDSLILGTGNHHDGDICLDVLNTMNKVALKLDTEFLSQVEEEPNIDLDTQDKLDQWNKFKEQSYMMYSLLASQGNRFHFNHKADKRGRIYVLGFHISTQGTSFKKASLEFAKEEVVTGAPNQP